MWNIILIKQHTFKKIIILLKTESEFVCFNTFLKYIIIPTFDKWWIVDCWSDSLFCSLCTVRQTFVFLKILARPIIKNYLHYTVSVIFFQKFFMHLSDILIEFKQQGSHIFSSKFNYLSEHWIARTWKPVWE